MGPGSGTHPCPSSERGVTPPPPSLPPPGGGEASVPSGAGSLGNWRRVELFPLISTWMRNLVAESHRFSTFHVSQPDPRIRRTRVLLRVFVKSLRRMGRGVVWVPGSHTESEIFDRGAYGYATSFFA